CEGRPIEIELVLAVGELLEERGATAAGSPRVPGEEPQHGVDVPWEAAVSGQARRMTSKDTVQQLAGFFAEAELEVLVGEVEPGVIDLAPCGSVVGPVSDGGLHAAQRGRPLAVGAIEPIGLPVEGAECQVRPGGVESMAGVPGLLAGQGLAGGQG